MRQQLSMQRVEPAAGQGASIAATCLVAREVGAPSGVKPTEWCLLTNRVVTTMDEVIELINWYRTRWEIEMLLNILKNARRVKALPLGTVERIERALALFLVVAWRVAHLMRLGRTCPELAAHLFFDPDEIRVAYLLTKTRHPAQPKLNAVLRRIARLGGFVRRKGNGEPGAKTIWLGLRDVHVAAKTLRLLRDNGGNHSCV